MVSKLIDTQLCTQLQYLNEECGGFQWVRNKQCSALTEVTLAVKVVLFLGLYVQRMVQQGVTRLPSFGLHKGSTVKICNSG